MTSAFRLVLVLLLHKDVQPIYLDHPAVKHLSVIEADNEGKAVRPSASCTETGLPVEEHRPPMYTAKGFWLCNTDPLHVQKKKTSSSVTAIRR